MKPKLDVLVEYLNSTPNKLLTLSDDMEAKISDLSDAQNSDWRAFSKIVPYFVATAAVILNCYIIFDDLHLNGIQSEPAEPINYLEEPTSVQKVAAAAD